MSDTPRVWWTIPLPLLGACAMALLIPAGVAAKDPLRIFTGHTSGIRAMSVSPDGTMVAAAATQYERPGEIRIWDIQSGKEVITVRLHPQSVSGLAFSPDGKYV